MEDALVRDARRGCAEAEQEQKRLRQRARYFNHRPEKASEILHHAENLPELRYCRDYERYSEILKYHKSYE